jgi:nucleoside phosphorylase
MSKKSVMCVAAAAVELEAISGYLDSEFGPGRTVHGVNRDHYARQFTDSLNGCVWFVTTLRFQGNLDAALEIPLLISSFQPDLVIMVGMCMGLDEGACVGTVIVPNEVYSFDHRRSTDLEVYRPHGEPTALGLHKLAGIVAAKSSRAYRVVTSKGLASASVKVERQDTSLILEIKKKFPDLIAFDMEGSGFVKACAVVPAIWVKAVADHGEAQGIGSDDQEEKRATQKLSCKNAINFAVELVREYCDSEMAVQPQINGLAHESVPSVTLDASTKARDIESIRFFMGMINIGMVENQIESLPSYIIYSSVVMFDSIDELLGSSAFFVYDEVTLSLMNDFRQKFGDVLRHSSHYDVVPNSISQKFAPNREEYSIAKIEELKAVIQSDGQKLRNALGKLVNRIRDVYREIDLAETNQFFAREYAKVISAK